MADSIFEELDRKSKSKSACTCGTMTLFLVVVLLGAVSGSLYLVSLAQERIEIARISPSQTSKDQVVEKINLFLQTKTSQPQAASALEITEQELTSLLAQTATADQEVSIKNLQAHITSDAVIFSGTLTKPFTSTVKVTTLPRVDNGKVVFDIVSITAGKVNLPKPVVALTQSRVNELINKNLDLARGITLHEIALRPGVMVLK